VVAEEVGAGVGGTVVGTFVGCGVTVCCGVAVRRGDGVAAGERCGLRRAGRGVGDCKAERELVGCAAALSPAVPCPGGLTHT